MIRITLWVDVDPGTSAMSPDAIAVAVADAVYMIDVDKVWTIDDVTHQIDKDDQ
jgi:hypothetical protein